MDLSKLVKRHRKELGLTQQELASHSGVSLRQIQEIELDKANPTVATVTALANVLGFSVSFLPDHKRPVTGRQVIEGLGLPSTPPAIQAAVEAHRLLTNFANASHDSRVFVIGLLEKDPSYLFDVSVECRKQWLQWIKESLEETIAVQFPKKKSLSK